MIKLTTMKDGEIVYVKTAKSGVRVEEVDHIACQEVENGRADYACVTVDGVIYSEWDA